VTITDGRGCTVVIDELLLEEPPFEFNARVAAFLDPSCAEAQDGSVTVEVIDGTAPYTFDWSNGILHQEVNNTTDLLENLPEGSYQVSITDANGCTAVSEAIAIAAPAPLELQLTTDNVSCSEFADGRIAATVTGGTGTYTYQWSNNATEATIDELGPGSYSLTVTDANNCAIRSEVVSIEQPGDMQLRIDGQQDVSCFGAADGSIEASVMGGTGNYTYQWTGTDQTVANPQNLSGGSYQLLVRDSNNCTVLSEIVTLQEASAPLSLSENVILPDVCLRNPAATIELNVAGGAGAYTYTWQDGNTEANRTDLSNGSYAVTVTDALGCSIVQQNMLVQLPEIELQADVLMQKNPACGDTNDGEVVVQVSNGTAPYQYLWNNGTLHMSTPDRDTIRDLDRGNYFVIITDANGCVDTSAQVQLDKPNLLDPTIRTSSTICHGASDGTVLLDVEGGRAPYTFSWDNGAAEQNLINVEAGTYLATVTDANACSITVEATVNQAAPFGNYRSLKKDISCYGLEDGSIEVSLDGGWRPLIYEWNSPNWDTTRTGANIGQLAPGRYMLTITDQKGCSEQDEFEVLEPDSLRVEASPFPTSCETATDGQINVSVVGGNFPYVFRWSNESIRQNLTSIPVGSYTLTVTDANECQEIVAPVEVLANNKLSYTILKNQSYSPPCGGSCTGSIDLDLQGDGEFEFLWDNGATVEDPEDLCPGLYEVTITDQAGCTSVMSGFEIVDDHPVMTLADTIITIANNCSVSDEHSVELLMTGGVGQYIYQWPDAAATTQRLRTGLSAGSYEVSISDEAGCELLAEIVIDCSTSTESAEVGLQQLRLYPNPTNGQVRLDLELSQLATVDLRIYSVVGQEVLQRPLARFREMSYELDVSHLPEGVYFVRLVLDGQQQVTRRLVKIAP
ncbi:MAG: T9SS type A sorting domain-containing protein, partial [Bacteroidota bacterium]